MDLNETSDERERILMVNEFHRRGLLLNPHEQGDFGAVRRSLAPNHYVMTYMEQQD